jgi:hypothetical protein
MLAFAEYRSEIERVTDRRHRHLMPGQNSVRKFEIA